MSYIPESDCAFYFTSEELAKYTQNRLKTELIEKSTVENNMRCKFYVESESYSTCKNLDWHHNGTYRCNCEGDASKCGFWRKKIPQCKYVNSKQNCGAECITMPYTSEMHPTGDLTCPFIDDWGIGKWVCRGYEPRSRFEVHVMGKEPNIIGVFKTREQAEQFIRDNVKVVEMTV